MLTFVVECVTLLAGEYDVYSDLFQAGIMLAAVTDRKAWYHASDSGPYRAGNRPHHNH